ncbi:metalloregulator ArsR/SmtB family transcription factor [Rhizobium sp. S163]|jgi:DNA-binding transcriptional ArsR family regulator|uniref:ArsR/SmtB family transcription factor n=1 Tax=Rhizobium sp. S163 TaxID=3055039 RepID=UPI000DDBF943|nr:metalloregulator ArsR/SmtB family transcription factor [Rhizobium sp. S163]MDM9645823.1 metalloregulator ArsR/SmtB family transcription factor [Rhizobium sp. S163]
MQEDNRNPQGIAALAEQLAVLGNANRLAILTNLAEGEIQVNVLAKKLGLGQSALSQHLAILRACEFVSTRRASQSVFYSIQPRSIAAALASARDLLIGAGGGEGERAVRQRP